MMKNHTNSPCVGEAVVRFLQRFKACSRGATAIEYAFITLLIFLAIVGGITLLGGSVHDKYEYVNDKAGGAMK